MNKSFDDYDIGDKIKKVLSAERIEYLGIQVFKKDNSNLLKWFNRINNGGNTQFANYVEDRDDEQEILSGELKKAVELEELRDVTEIEIKPSAVK